MKTLLLSCLLAAINIVPRPHEMEVKRGTLEVQPGLSVVLPLQATPAEVSMAEDFASGFKPPLPIVRSEDHDGRKGIFFGERDRQPVFEGLLMKRRVKGAEKLPSAGYYLNIWSKGVAVIGADHLGTFYGMQTLRQIAHQAGGAWPELEIRDWPRKPWRGAVLSAPPSYQQLQALASHKINLLILESTDFLAQDTFAGGAWPRVFEEARALHMTPVPQFSIFDDAESLLYLQPLAAEGEVAEEQVLLKGLEAKPLKQHHIIATEEAPAAVAISSVRCMPERDYLLELPPPQAPFHAIGAPGTIRRVAGGSIPSGATVTVKYSYAPESAAALCPNAPETLELLDTLMRSVDAQQYMYLGGHTIAALNRDQRCISGGQSDTEVFVHAVEVLRKARRKAQPNAEVIVSLDGILARVKDRAEARVALQALPEDVTPMVELEGAEQDAAEWEAVNALGRRFLAVLKGNGDYEAQGQLSGLSESRELWGVLVREPDVASEAFQAAIHAAW